MPIQKSPYFYFFVNHSVYAVRYPSKENSRKNFSFNIFFNKISHVCAYLLVFAATRSQHSGLFQIPSFSCIVSFTAAVSSNRNSILTI